MNRNVLILIMFLLFVSCKNAGKAEKLYKQACEMFQPEEIMIWVDNPSEKDKIIKILDEVIEIKPNWWEPYREKIQVLKIGSLEENAETVKDVYNLWLNNNSLDGFDDFSYACSLYCSGDESLAISKFNELYVKYSDKKITDEEKIIFIFSGIIVKKITEEDLSSCVLSLFPEAILIFIQEFFINFYESPKAALWGYV